MGITPTVVSVIVPTSDRPELLAEALASIRALEGDDLTLEILVGDNGKSLNARAVAERFGARYFQTPKHGAGAARNVALRAASGKYLAFLDDDDVWLPGHLREHVALLQADASLEAVFGQVQSTDVDRKPEGLPWPHAVPSDGDLFVMMLSGYFPQLGATVARARVRETLGEFDESLLGDQDWDWQLRIASNHRIGFVHTPCVLFRQRPMGTFDALTLRRLPFTRRVFLRHALPARKRWRSWGDFLHTYQLAFQTYYVYFVRSAEVHAELGERTAALRSVVNAFRMSPLRAGRHAIAGPLRPVLASIFSSAPLVRKT